MLKIDSEINLVKLIVKQIIGEKESIIDTLNFNHINWQRFKDLITYHELTPFAYLTLKDYNPLLSQELREFLEKNYYCAVARCQYLWNEFLRISTAFGQAGIVIVPIKGIALLEDIYTQKTIRPMIDIDLLVKEDDLRKAEKIFCNLGYRKELYGLKEDYWRKNQCHITFYKKNDNEAPFVELHWSLDFKRRGLNVLLELWNRIRQLNVDGRTIKLLSPEDTLFSLALHNRRVGRTLCLKNAYDLLLLLNKYIGNFDWKYVLNQSKKYELCSTVFFILYQTSLLSKLNLPEYVWKELNLSALKRKLIQRFIEKNTFLLDKKMQNKNLYLKSHFLLYDSLWEPIDYILNIPQEQFAKFYRLAPYTTKTNLLYRTRYLYFLINLYTAIIKGIIKRFFIR